MPPLQRAIDEAVGRLNDMRIDALRKMPPARRVEMAIEMSEIAMQISAAGAERRRARRESA